MSTNYYIKLPNQNHCNHCGRNDPGEEIHIGKYTYGIKFLFANDKGACRNFREWKALLEEHQDRIFNEYGNPVTLESLMHLIQSSQSGAHELIREYTYLDPEGYYFMVGDFC